MCLDRGFGNRQIEGDLLVQLAFADELQNARLLIGQRREPRQRLGVCVGHLAFDITGRGENLARRNVFQRLLKDVTCLWTSRTEVCYQFLH